MPLNPDEPIPYVPTEQGWKTVTKQTNDPDLLDYAMSQFTAIWNYCESHEGASLIHIQEMCMNANAMIARHTLNKR